MRIAYVCVDPGIPVFGTKGASVHIQEIIREMRNHGHHVSVHALKLGKHIPADLSDLPVHIYPVSASDPTQREEEQIEASHAIADAIRNEHPDMIYERYSLFSTVLDTSAHHSQHTSACVRILEVNAPLIEEQARHRILVNEEKAWKALNTQVRAAHATICVSEPVTEWVRSHVDVPTIHTVANGVNTTRIHPQPEDPSTVVVTFVGTLKPWHGVEDLLTAASQARHPWKLRILGDGPERERLETLATQLGVDADFRGAIPPENMSAQLAGSAIAVAPYPASTGEDSHYFSPLKVYEYMAAGLPVVASNIGQNPQALDGAGILVHPSAPAELAHALDTLAVDTQRRRKLGARGRDLAVKQHSWTRVFERICAHAGIERSAGGRA